MDELVFKSENGNPVTTSFLVAEKFGKEHKNVLQAIKEIIRSAENSAHLYYSTAYTDRMNRKQEMFIMNRDGFTLLVMGFTGSEALKFKLDFIDAFNRMEQALKSQVAQLPQDYLSALKALVVSEEAKQLAESKLKEAEPKILFADSVNASSDSILIADLAKLLKQNGIEIGQNRLFKWMRENGYLCSKGDYYNRPTQRAMEMGLFEVIERTHEDRKNNAIFTTFTTKVTGKGQLYFINKFLNKNAA